MNIIVQGTKEFADYPVFVRAMGVAMSDMGDDKDFNVYTVGPVNINNYTAQFCNMTETSMRARGKRIRFYRVPAIEVESNMDNFQWFGFFADPAGKPSHLFYAAAATDMETAIFRF